MRKKLLIIHLILIFATEAFSQGLSSGSRQAVNTINEILPQLHMNPQYTQPIGVDKYAQVRQDWDVYLQRHNRAIAAWNTIPQSEYRNAEVNAVRKPLADRIAYFKKWTEQMQLAQAAINSSPIAAAARGGGPISETSKAKLVEIADIISKLEMRRDYAGTLSPPQYVPATEWLLKTRGKFSHAARLWNSLQDIERVHPDAVRVEKMIHEIEPVVFNVEKQLKAVSVVQISSGLGRMWRQDTEKYKDSVLIFADVLGIDLPQNTTNSRTLFELKPENFDKTMKDLEELSVLMSGTYKDLIDNFGDFFPTLEKSVTVYRLVSVNRKQLLPQVVKLSAARFLAGVMNAAPRIEDLEKDEGWMEGNFTPSESKKRVAEIKLRFTPLLKRTGISEQEAGLDELDSAYDKFWQKADELAPKWEFPSDSTATGDARARAIFTREIKAAYPNAQIVRLGFAYDAKWTIYMSGGRPQHRTIGTTALFKIPGEKHYTAWRLLFNEDHVGGGRFSGGSIQWLKWRWQGNR